MAFDLYCSLLSPSSRAVVVTAKHLGVDFNIKEVDILKEEQLSDEFIKLNPTHKVPVLVEGDFVLWESRAIMRYLCNKYAPDGSLYPSDLEKRAIVDQMLDFDTSLFRAMHDVVVNQFKGSEPTEQQKDNLEKILKQLDGMITGRTFVAGDELTIADISMAHTVSLLGFNEFKDMEDSGVKTWYEGMKDNSNHFQESCEMARVAFDKYLAEKQSTE